MAPQQGKSYYLRHRAEHFAFNANQRHDGQVNNQDDDLPESGGTHHTFGRFENILIHLLLRKFCYALMMVLAHG